MDRGRILEGLKEVRNILRAEGHRSSLLQEAEAAIALIEPQPVTEAGLREAGFRDELSCGRCKLQVSENLVICWDKAHAFWVNQSRGPSFSLDITDMQHLNAVIAALEGK